jgi:hypothetical protein
MRRHLLILTVALAACAGVFAQTTSCERLKALPLKIAYEGYVDDNCELFVMNADGKVIAFLPQEYPRFSVIGYYSTGLSFYDRATGRIVSHPNGACAGFPPLS